MPAAGQRLAPQTEKRCTICKRVQPAAMFSVERTGRLGSRCRAPECKQYKRERFYAQRGERRQDPAFLELERQWGRDHQKRSQHKMRIHVRVYRAVKLGLLKKEPCQVCGATRVEAHHDDYSKPLDVRWLCHLHHKEWHLQNGEGRNANAG